MKYVHFRSSCSNEIRSNSYLGVRVRVRALVGSAGTRPHASGDSGLSVLRKVRVDAEVARHVRLERVAAALDLGDGGTPPRACRGGATDNAHTAGDNVVIDCGWTLPLLLRVAVVDSYITLSRRVYVARGHQPGTKEDASEEKTNKKAVHGVVLID